MRISLVLTGLVLLAPVLYAGYVLEWSAPLSYSMAYAYTANRTVNYDITGDSIPELLVSDSSALRVYSGVSHNLIWSIPLSYTYGGYPLIANTDGDVGPELVFSAYSYSYPNYLGRFYIYDCATHNLEYSSTVKNGYLSLALADIDGDAKSEICLASGPAGSRILEVYGSTDAPVSEFRPGLQISRGQAAPNPARRPVRILLDAAGSFPVAIFDPSGRIIRTLANPGIGEVLWDGCDDAGLVVPAGTYLFRAGSTSGRVELRE